jgi:betaine-aldehyde dehydrogenase
VDTKKREVQNFVGGEHVDSADGRTYDLMNPATGEVFAQAPMSGKADVDRAFEVAEKAFESWRDSTPSQRQLALLKLADAIEERAEELVRAESQNTGKPYSLTMEEEVTAMVDQIRFFAGVSSSSHESLKTPRLREQRLPKRLQLGAWTLGDP